MINQYWSWALSIVGAFGMYLTGKKDWRGWVVVLVNEVVWFTYAIVTKQYGFFVGCFFYGIVGTKNLIQWLKDHKKRV
jgi:hypothetical protein